MSVSSNGSCISVSINGEEMDLETAINDVFVGIQRHLNESQTSLRTLAMLIEKDDIEFRESVAYSDKIDDDIDQMMLLFKSLKSVVKQIICKPESEDKEWFRLHLAERKIQILQKKNKAKVDTVAE